MMAKKSKCSRQGPVVCANRAVSCTHPSRWQAAAFLLGILCTLPMIQAQGNHSLCENLDPSPSLKPFVQPLPIPAVIDISTGSQLIIGAYKISQSVHPELPNTTFYAYGTSQATATYPGPTLEAQRDVSSFIRFENHLTDPDHIFTVDKTLHVADPPRGGVPMITHLHGADAESQYDGHPEAWYTALGDTGPTFVTRNNTYPNQQPASLLWYHDHTIGMTRLNVAAGLAGLYIIRGGDEPADLPQGDYEVPLVIQDRQFFPNGSVNFPDTGFVPGVHPNWCPDYFGDTILVNGKAWPYLNVTRNIYRFRILNGANGRVFTLSFGDSRVKFLQIGTDGGFLWTPLELTNLTIPSAYRVDVLVDFSDVEVGAVVSLNNSAPAPFANGNPLNSPPSTKYVMQFNVVANATNQTVVVPESIAARPDIDALARNATVHRNVTLQFITPPDLQFLIDGRHWVEPVTETPEVYTTEVWDITHLIPVNTHPMHIHLVNFLVVHEQSFNLTRRNDQNCTFDLPYPDPGSCFTEAPQPPDALHTGWKDTILVRTGTVLRLVLEFSPRAGGTYPFDPTTFPGYVWHCHIIDHEDNDMMRPLQFLPPK